MSWFTEQIKDRKEKDNALLKEAVNELNEAVTGHRQYEEKIDPHRASRNALNQILYSMHLPEADIPDTVRTLDEQLAYAMNPHGIMWRQVSLEHGWYRNAVGPILARRKADETWVALLPGKFYGYRYIDPNSGNHITMTRKNEDELACDGYCFYSSFPPRAMGISDLIQFILKTIAPSTYIIMALMTFLVTLVGMLVPRITYLIYTVVLKSKSPQMLLSIATFSLCTGISLELMNTIRTIINERLNTQLDMSVQAAAMARIISLPTSFFREFNAGELSNKMDSIRELCSSLVSSIFSLSLSSLFSLIYLFQVFQYTPALVIPSLVITAVTVFHTIIVILMEIRINEKLMDISAKLDGVTVGLLSGIQKIKLSGSEKRVLTKWMNLFAKKVRLTYQPPFIVSFSDDISLAISLIGEFVLYFLAIRNHVSVAEYNAFDSAYGMVSGAFLALVGIASSLGQIRPILKVAQPILDAVPENNERHRIIPNFTGDIELNHVSFRYENNMPPVINDLSLHIKRGQYLAIVGESGCGKSTLVRLLLGFEKVQRGAIYYDRQDINSLDLRNLRQKIGTVMQDGTLMNGDILSNITITAPQATLEDAWAAAEIAGIAEDIREMPMGMNTVIAEGNSGISGGQKQRLLIAQAIVGHPKILIFDEATSALDNLTQKQISDALSSMNCTRIVIAHRLSTIRHCDRILYLENGRIAEDGTYDELIAKEGKFADLVKRQRLDIS